MLGLLSTAAFTFGFLAAIADQLPRDPLLATKQSPEANTYVYAANGRTVLAILRGDQARIPVPSAQISPVMKHAIVAIEDKRFYEHRGVDLRGIVRAVWADARNKAVVQGGSTITQQFVKNSINQKQTTISRKLREAALAWQLEQKWSKDRILTAYLNTVYFANRAYGVEQASRIYFGHSAREMTWAEAALLAGIPQDPTLYDPVAHPQKAKARRNVVLRALYADGYITAAQLRRARQAPMPTPRRVTLPSTHGQAAQYFANYATDQLVDVFGAKRVYGGGLRVRTTIDVDLQKIARQAVANVLPPSVGPEAALVALDARTGDVLAMVGGRNYHKSQYNLATQSQRQTGSAFKPIVLATALRDGISPSTVFDSHPVTINADGIVYEPENYEGEYLGPIDLTKAIAYSDNSVFAQLTKTIGPRNVVETARVLGIDPDRKRLKPYFSIGLGGQGASPLEMARAYSSFANGGFRTDGSITGNRPRVIRCLTDAHRRCKADNKVVARPVLAPTPEVTKMRAAVVDQLLQGVVRFGTGTAAQIPGREVAGKTGTTDDYGDAWFVGFTPQLVAAVWVGYPDRLQPMKTEFHGDSVAGGTYPALIWKRFMERALAHLKKGPEPFVAPVGTYSTAVNVVYRNGRIERDNGYCRDTFQLSFFGNQQPSRLADCKPNEVEVPDVRGAALAAAKARLAAQPLSSTVVYRPARAGERPGVVLGQDPSGGGRLSAWDEVTLVLGKPQHGVVPRLVGLPVSQARDRLAALRVDVRVDGGAEGKVVAQTPRPGVAAAPGMRVVLSVRRAG